MVTCGIQIDMVIYNTLLNGLCKAGKMEKAREIMSEMTRMCVRPDSRSYILLIQGYCRKRDMVSASELLDEMKKMSLAPMEVTYRVMINALCQYGNLQQEKYCFEGNDYEGFETECRYLYKSNFSSH